MSEVTSPADRPRAAALGRHSSPGEPGRAPRSFLRSTAGLMALVMVVAVVGGLLITLVLPKTYTTEAQVLLRPRVSSAEVTVTQVATMIGEQSATYAALVGTPTVLDPAIAASGADTDSATLQDEVTSTVVPNTNLIEIDASAADAQAAAQLTKAIADSLVTQIGEQSQVAGEPLVEGVVVEEPLVPTAPSSPSLPLNLAISLAIGLAVCGGIVAVRAAPRRSQSSS
ncbi:hypothetical protein ACFFKU_17660 [Kineococcus gynurae]|uniref:Capsular polysaccharide biosynthesis protein n=1 Tax=Kineococcus gynurae TaxID=452979 RepID=A0ABV5LNN6_9ACTN